MKAFGFNSADSAPILFEQDTAEPQGRDLLIAIDAIAVNPVDTKVKAGIQGTLDTPKVVGWDAAGTVIATGPDCQFFKSGDKVFYAGDVTRPGCYASHQLIDERIVGHAPKSLRPEQAAAMPLTSITAWEALFSRLKIRPDTDKGKTILIIGAAGGVGSIGIQLAKVVAGMNVVATASRPESANWCQRLGADHVINHHDLINEYQALGIEAPDYILCLSDTDPYFETMCELIAPQGMICIVVTSKQNHNIDVLKNKSAGLVWEFMFTRPMFNTTDVTQQHQLLNRIAEMLDAGQLFCTLTDTIGPISADNISLAHQRLLSGTTIGKIALTSMPE